LSNFSIAELDDFSEKLASPKYRQLEKKLRTYVYYILKVNPYYGPNIKALKHEFKGLHRYRIGDYRIFYQINAEKKLIYMVDIQHRKDAYR